jgi:hypothetical protein
MAHMWPWILLCFELVGVFGQWSISRGHWWGFVVVLLHSWPWCVYSVVTGQPGFLAMFVLWQIVNGAGAVRWYRNRTRTV